MSLKTRVILVLVVGTIMGLGLSIGGGIVAQKNPPLPQDFSWEHARQLAEVMERVKRDYIEPVDEQELLDVAIRAMVSELDRHSQYLDSSEYEDIRISATGSYTGIGIEVSTEDDRIMVIAPIDGTPAQRAGIKSGDVIVAIDNVQIDKHNLSDTISMMRGRPGSTVIVTVDRENQDDHLVYSIERERIHVASVRHELLDPSYGYIRVSQFTDSTAAEVRDAIDELDAIAAEKSVEDVEGFIIDLRDNPGGILDAAVDVSDLFLNSGVIVTADGRTPEARFSRDASFGELAADTPLVILVNNGSASASEIVAGALQDHNRATVIGTSTFGKGLVQTVMPLSRGRAIKLTTSRYYTPSGDSIHETGISPDIHVDGSDEFPGYSMNLGVDRENDAQLVEALEFLRNQRVAHSDAT